MPQKLVIADNEIARVFATIGYKLKYSTNKKRVTWLSEKENK